MWLDDEKQNKIKDLLEKMQKNIVSPADLERFITFLLKNIEKSKGEISQLSQENIAVIKESIAKIESIHEKAINTLDSKTNTATGQFQAKLDVLKALVAKVKTYKPPVDGLDGKDANPADVVPLVLKELKLPEYKETVLDGRKEIVEKINTGKKNDLKIELKQIEGADKLTTQKNLDNAISILDQRTKFLINKNATASGGGHTIQDEGTPLTQRTNLNFVGAGVTATDDAGNDATVVTISGGGGSAGTLAETSALSTDATKSLYTMTSTIPVEFKSSDGNTLLYLDETNERIGVGTATPLTALDINTGTLRGATIISPAGTILAAASTAPAQITTAQTGTNITLTASNAVAGSSVVGAAVGGNIIITAGDAARLTSGNARGGVIQLSPGASVGTGNNHPYIVTSAADPRTGISLGSTSGMGLTAYVNGTAMATGANIGGFTVWEVTALGFAATVPTSTPDLILTRAAAATIQLGAASTTTAGVAQTLQTQGAITTADTAGGSLTIRTGAGTGAAVGAPIYFATPDATTSGSTAQAQTTKMTILGNGKVGIGTTAPAYTLQVIGGIGTTNGAFHADAGGGIYVANVSFSNQAYLASPASNTITVSQDGYASANDTFRASGGRTGDTNYSGANFILGGGPSTGTGVGGSLIFKTSGTGLTGSTINALTERMRVDSTGNVGIGTTAPTSTLHSAGSFSVGYVAKTADYTLTISDSTVNFTANNCVATLPTAASITGRIYNIKNTGTGVITLNTTSSQTIDGAASGTITLVQWDNYTVQSDGANWIVL